MTDYSNVSAILLGGRWLQVSNGSDPCGGQVSFRTSPFTRLVIREGAIDAVKVIERPEDARRPINTPWED